MPSAVYGSMTGENLQALMRKVLQHKPSTTDTVPSLQARIENIGHDKARMGKPASEVAAAHYLGASTNAVIQLIDKLWLQTYLRKRKRRVQQGHTQAASEKASSS